MGLIPDRGAFELDSPGAVIYPAAALDSGDTGQGGGLCEDLLGDGQESPVRRIQAATSALTEGDVCG